MMIDDLTRIDRTIDVNAPPDRVWRALTTAADLAAWFQVGIEGEILPGAEIWMTSKYPGHEGPAVDYSREPWTTVTFTLEPSGRGTRLTVSETGFNEISLARRAKVFQDNSQGWTEVLVWIQKYVEAKN